MKHALRRRRKRGRKSETKEEHSGFVSHRESICANLKYMYNKRRGLKHQKEGLALGGEPEIQARGR